jgi:hypothetical protein
VTDRQPNLQAVDLSTYSAEALVDAIIRLTHMTRSAGTAARADAYRAQRDVARRELLSRCREV